MQQIEDTIGEPIKAKIGEPNADPDPGLADRFRRATRGLDKPKTRVPNPAFRNLSIDERRERLLAVETLAHEYLSAEQITDFLPAWGLNVPLSRVYVYLSQVRLPKNYKRIVAKRSRRLHDGLATSHLIRIARDAAEFGLRVERIQVARKLGDARVIPDNFWFVGPNGYFMEEQIAPLPDTRWRDKLRAYLKRRLLTNDSIRVLFIVNDLADMTRARAYARELLVQYKSEGMKLFLFAEQLTLKGSANVVTAPVWRTPWSNTVSLEDWMRLPGGSPTVPHQ